MRLFWPTLGVKLPPCLALFEADNLSDKTRESIESAIADEVGPMCEVVAV